MKYLREEKGKKNIYRVGSRNDIINVIRLANLVMNTEVDEIKQFPQICQEMNFFICVYKIFDKQTRIFS